MMKKYCFLAVLLFTVLIGSGCVSNCDSLKEEINAKIGQANYCSVDADCVIEYFGCPFGCGSYVNKNADTASIREQIKSYSGACGTCEYDCFEPVPPVCLNGKCQASGSVNEVTVRQKAIGTKLTYYDLGGGEQTKIVRDEDILAIESEFCPSATETKNCYRVSIGEAGGNVLMWYIFYDAETLEQVKVEQLFVT